MTNLPKTHFCIKRHKTLFPDYSSRYKVQRWGVYKVQRGGVSKVQGFEKFSEKVRL